MLNASCFYTGDSPKDSNVDISNIEITVFVPLTFWFLDEQAF